MPTAARKQQAFGSGRSRGRRQRAQRKNASHDPSHVAIGRYQTFGLELAERDLQGPLVHTDLPQTVQREIDTLADADSGGASEQQRIGGQVVSPAQFLLQLLIVMERKRSWQVPGLGREVLAADKVWRPCWRQGKITRRQNASLPRWLIKPVSSSRSNE